MSNELIRNVAIDIITITTMWGLLNNPYISNLYTFKFYLNSYDYNDNHLPRYSSILGIAVSTIILSKYL